MPTMLRTILKVIPGLSEYTSIIWIEIFVKKSFPILSWQAFKRVD